MGSCIARCACLLPQLSLVIIAPTYPRCDGQAECTRFLRDGLLALYKTIIHLGTNRAGVAQLR